MTPRDPNARRLVGTTAPCRRCATPFLTLATYAHRRGYCTETCRRVRAFVPTPPRTVTCLVCARIFTTRHALVMTCGASCRRAMTLAQRAERYACRKEEAGIVDLSAAEIDAKLERLAAHRKATRSWLRIENPWAQRAGSALHQSAVITHSMDLDGAYQ